MAKTRATQDLENPPLDDRQVGLLEMLDVVTKQMGAAVTRCSRDFRYLWANQAYADWLQRPLQDVVGRPIIEVLGNGAFEALLPHFKRVLTGEKVHYEQETNFRDIGRRWISATYTPTLDATGIANGWVALVIDITERKRMEEARFRHTAIVESSEDAIISKDLDAVITSWNLGAERIFGYTETEVVGQPITILIPPELVAEESTILQRLRAGERIEHYQTKRLTKAGKTVDVSLTIGPIKNSSGRVVGFCKIAHDITKQKASENAVKESETRFRLVADTAPVLIWMSGLDKLCIYFNKPWLDFTGRSFAEEYGNGWVEGVHTHDVQSCLDTYTQSFDSREKFAMEYRLRRYDGEYRWVLDIGVPRFNQDGSFAGYIGVAVDITEHKRAEEKLQESEQRFRLVANTAPVMIWMSGADNKPTYFNQLWMDFTGLSETELQNRLAEIIHPEDYPRCHEVYCRGFDQRQPFRKECRLRRHDGQYRWMLDIGVPRFLKDGSFAGYIGSCIDVTQQKEAEEAISAMTRKLVEAQDQERARIARELHDDINQRLALLSVEIETAKNSPDTDLSVLLTEFRERIDEISTDLQSLSHQLHSSHLEYLGIMTATRSFCREFSAVQGVEVDFEHDNVPSTVARDVSLCIFRVLQEALHNAFKHSGARHFDVRLSCFENQLHLTVSDCGVGFDINAAQTDGGLGLTSMRERVRLVNGTISIESRPMIGTTIHVRVPLESEQCSEQIPV